MKTHKLFMVLMALITILFTVGVFSCDSKIDLSSLEKKLDANTEELKKANASLGENVGENIGSANTALTGDGTVRPINQSLTTIENALLTGTAQTAVISSVANTTSIAAGPANVADDLPEGVTQDFTQLIITNPSVKIGKITYSLVGKITGTFEKNTASDDSSKKTTFTIATTPKQTGTITVAGVPIEVSVSGSFQIESTQNSAFAGAAAFTQAANTTISPVVEANDDTALSQEITVTGLDNVIFTHNGIKYIRTREEKSSLQIVYNVDEDASGDINAANLAPAARDDEVGTFTLGSDSTITTAIEPTFQFPDGTAAESIKADMYSWSISVVGHSQVVTGNALATGIAVVAAHDDSDVGTDLLAYAKALDSEDGTGSSLTGVSNGIVIEATSGSLKSKGFASSAGAGIYTITATPIKGEALKYAPLTFVIFKI